MPDPKKPVDVPPDGGQAALELHDKLQAQIEAWEKDPRDGYGSKFKEKVDMLEGKLRGRMNEYAKQQGWAESSPEYKRIYTEGWNALMQEMVDCCDPKYKDKEPPLRHVDTPLQSAENMLKWMSGAEGPSKAPSDVSQMRGQLQSPSFPVNTLASKKKDRDGIA